MEIYVSFSSSSLHLFGYSVVHASKEVASEEMMKSYAFVIYEFRFGNKEVREKLKPIVFYNCIVYF